MSKSKQNVYLNNNIITIHKMENQFCVSDFIRCMQKAIRHINKDSVYKKTIESDVFVLKSIYFRMHACL